MKEMMLEKLRSDGVAAVFHEDEGEGYFFLYNPLKQEVLQQVQLYTRPPDPEIREEDVDVFWSHDEETAGLAVWGRMRALLGVKEREEEAYSLERPDSPAIERHDKLSTFQQYLDRKSFLHARKRYWKTALLKARPDLALPDSDTSLLETRFLVAAMDSAGRRAAVFEDDGETGYLYLYGVEAGNVLNHVHVYDHSKALKVTKGDVRVLWSADATKCAVEIWGHLRGIIDLRGNREGRAWVENRDTPGISDREWLEGFQLA